MSTTNQSSSSEKKTKTSLLANFFSIGRDPLLTSIAFMNCHDATSFTTAAKETRSLISEPYYKTLLTTNRPFLSNINGLKKKNGTSTCTNEAVLRASFKCVQTLVPSIVIPANSFRITFKLTKLHSQGRTNITCASCTFINKLTCFCSICGSRVLDPSKLTTTTICERTTSVTNTGTFANFLPLPWNEINAAGEDNDLLFCDAFIEQDTTVGTMFGTYAGLLEERDADTLFFEATDIVPSISSDAISSLQLLRGWLPTLSLSISSSGTGRLTIASESGDQYSNCVPFLNCFSRSVTNELELQDLPFVNYQTERAACIARLHQCLAKFQFIVVIKTSEQKNVIKVLSGTYDNDETISMTLGNDDLICDVDAEIFPEYVTIWAIVDGKSIVQIMTSTFDVDINKAMIGGGLEIFCNSDSSLSAAYNARARNTHMGLCRESAFENSIMFTPDCYLVGEQDTADSPFVWTINLSVYDGGREENCKPEALQGYWDILATEGVVAF